eukprot:746522-Hanusia_phi.AAC.5
MFAPGLNPFQVTPCCEKSQGQRSCLQNSLFAIPHPPGKPGEQNLANNVRGGGFFFHPDCRHVPGGRKRASSVRNALLPTDLGAKQTGRNVCSDSNQARGSTLLKNDHERQQAGRGNYGERASMMLEILTCKLTGTGEFPGNQGNK